MRTITTHHDGAANDAIVIEAVDSWLYLVKYPSGFRKGIDRSLTNEVLLAIVRDPLEGFLKDKPRCHQHARALNGVKNVMKWLNDLTAERGVEGKPEA